MNILYILYFYSILFLFYLIFYSIVYSQNQMYFRICMKLVTSEIKDRI